MINFLLPKISHNLFLTYKTCQCKYFTKMICCFFNNLMRPKYLLEVHMSRFWNRDFWGDRGGGWREGWELMRPFGSALYTIEGTKIWQLFLLIMSRWRRFSKVIDISTPNTKNHWQNVKCRCVRNEESLAKRSSSSMWGHKKCKKWKQVDSFLPFYLLLKICTWWSCKKKLCEFSE